MEKTLQIGRTYAVTTSSECSVTDSNGLVLCSASAGEQKVFVATTSTIIFSDDSASVVAVFNSAPALGSGGGSSYTLTAEAVEAVIPITAKNGNVSLGENASCNSLSVAVGYNSSARNNCVSVGYYAKTANVRGGVAIGSETYSSETNAVSVGSAAKAKGVNALTIGSSFTETVDGESVAHTCTTEGTGSITIGAGANTLNTTASDGTVTESSNAVTIGCKAANSGADSVVIGAQASGVAAGTVVMGAGAGARNNSVALGASSSASSLSIAIGDKAATNAAYSVAIGRSAKSGEKSVAIGSVTEANNNCVVLGGDAKAKARFSVTLGYAATVSDLGATVIRSTAEDGTYTQLYFSGANTPLANTYHGGAPMLGYVTKDSAGNIVAAGTRSLLELLTDNSTFAPATVGETGEWVMPKVFHPSDLDLPNEEVTEPTEEEYTPLPVYPIVEPEIEELTENE